MYFCEADIKQLGVRNSAHRACMVSSLVALRDKYEHGKYMKQLFSVITFIIDIAERISEFCIQIQM